jgi:hypothetical protein
MTNRITVTGLKELDRALEMAPAKTRATLKRAMGKALAILQNSAATYPRRSEANQPGRFSLTTKRPMGYYERGRGWWYPVMKKTTLPEALGKTRGAQKARRRTGVTGYKLAGGGKSELLGRKWTTRVVVGEQAVQGVLGNNVSYAKYVQGDRQSRVHARRGWLTLKEIVAQKSDDIAAVFDSEIDDLLRDMET